MSTYETNPAGLGIGKRYGALNRGGVSGVYRGEGSNREFIFELGAKEPLTGKVVTLPVVAGYVVTAIWVEVEEAFAASSTVNLSINGGVALTTPISLATIVPLTSVALTGLTNLSGTTTVNIVLTGNANAIASGTGKARVLVAWKAV